MRNVRVSSIRRSRDGFAIYTISLSVRDQYFYHIMTYLQYIIITCDMIIVEKSERKMVM